MLPRLDLHVHSQYSPCAEDVSVERDAATALARGLRVLAVTDHGTTQVPEWLEDYFGELERVRRKFEGRLALLSGMEVDIVDGGRLAVSEWVLRRLDVVVASLHSAPAEGDPHGYWRRSLIRAIESGYVMVLGHPTDVGWRKVAPPEEYALEVLDAARSHGVAVELNFHHRDPAPWFLRLAIERGVLLVPDSDAHSLSEIGSRSWHEQRIRALGYDPGSVRWLTEGQLTRLLG